MAQGKETLEPAGLAPMEPAGFDTGVLALDAAVNPALRGRVLVLGGGYTGRRFATALQSLGVAVSLTRRDPVPASTPTDGLHWLRFDPAAGALPSPAALEGTSAVLVTIPPDARGQDPVLEFLAGTLQRLNPHWIGYLSTTGVYGDTGGAWVDETSPVAPGLPRSQARLGCERAWRNLGAPLQVFRLPAIYGPGRSPLDTLRRGEARLIHKPGQVFSRIHVDDIVGALLHCLALPATRRPATLILADCCPCPSSEMLGFAAHLLGCKLPDVQSYAQCAPQLSPMARSFWSENRRASSRCLQEEVGYRLRHPSFREGLRAVMATENRAAGRSDPE
jgi:nucleoside-diphosphate-sugar epimerase